MPSSSPMIGSSPECTPTCLPLPNANLAIRTSSILLRPRIGSFATPILPKRSNYTAHIAVALNRLGNHSPFTTLHTCWPIIRPFGRQSIVATSCCKTISGLRKSPVRAGPIIHSLSKRYARQRRSLTGPSRITATARKRPKRRLLWPSVTP